MPPQARHSQESTHAPSGIHTRLRCHVPGYVAGHERINRALGVPSVICCFRHGPVYPRARAPLGNTRRAASPAASRVTPTHKVTHQARLCLQAERTSKHGRTYVPPSYPPYRDPRHMILEVIREPLEQYHVGALPGNSWGGATRTRARQAICPRIAWVSVSRGCWRWVR